MHHGEVCSTNFSCSKLNPFKFLTSLSRIPLIRALFPLIPSNPLLSFPPALRPSIVRLSSFLLLLFIDLHQPLVVAVLIFTLVAPPWNPLAALLVVNHFALVAFLLVDTLLRSKELPFRGRFLCRNGLFAGERCGRRREDKVHAI